MFNYELKIEQAVINLLQKKDGIMKFENVKQKKNN